MQTYKKLKNEHVQQLLISEDERSTYTWEYRLFNCSVNLIENIIDVEHSYFLFHFLLLQTKHDLFHIINNKKLIMHMEMAGTQVSFKKSRGWHAHATLP